MTTTHRFASLLFIALAPLSACMDATGANGTGRDVASNPLTDEVADSDRPAEIGDQPLDLSHLISARATCAAGVGVIHAYTSGPAQELDGTREGQTVRGASSARATIAAVCRARVQGLDATNSVRP